MMLARALVHGNSRALWQYAIQWDSWSCVMGWPVMGIWSDYSDGTDINALARSNSEKFAVAGTIHFTSTITPGPSKRLVEDSEAVSGHWPSWH